MTKAQEQAIRIIEGQQKAAGEGTMPWAVGEQMKALCREEPASAELMAKDLQVEGMGIEDVEKQVKALADKRRERGKNYSFALPSEVDALLRAFYGLPGREAAAVAAPAAAASVEIDLDAIFGG